MRSTPHRNAAGQPLHRDPPVSDDAWPEGLWPLVVRGMDPTGGWLHGAEVSVSPAEGVLYDTREPVPREPFRLLRWDVQLRALVPPGEYAVTFRHPDLEYTRRVEVLDPTLDVATVEFRDGRPLHVRPGTWDDFIVKEQPYRRLLDEIRPCDLVMDVGAHIGTFTRDALAAGAARVVAYEPETVNARLLRENTAGLPVTVMQGCLVGDTGSCVRLWVDGGETGRNALHSVARSRGDRLPVRVPAWNFTEEVWRVRPAVLKVDVEEAEWAYSWEMPPEVQAVAVELERPKVHAAEIAAIVACLEGQGYRTVRQPAVRGWATMGVWARSPE